MRSEWIFLCSAVLALSMAGVDAGRAGPRPALDLSRALNQMQNEHASLVTVHELAVTRDERPVWLVEVGAGSSDGRMAHPAMLVVAGLEATDLAGTEAAMAFVERLVDEAATDDGFRERLETTTVYVIPRLNMDGSERFFEQPGREFDTNLTPHDADNDGFTDEDPPEDVNSDGLVTWMRVAEPGGELMPHPDDDRLLIEADAARGETGGWILLREGRDNDGDEQVNEDDTGGTGFHHNFPYDYPWFDDEAGALPLSEAPTRALAEWVVNHPHIGLVVAYGSPATLLQPPSSGDASDRRQPQTEWRSEDAELVSHLGERFREALEIDGEIETESMPGGFADWMYFHQGRMALTATMWNPELALALDATTDDETGDGESDAEESETGDEESRPSTGEKRGQSEFRYLQWVDETHPGRFVAWEPIEHPDYPGQRVEIGGWAPYAKRLPPDALMGDLVDRHAGFLRSLVDDLPRVTIESVEVEPLGGGVFSLTVRVQNLGYLPTITTHGDRTHDMLPTRVEIDLPGDAFVAGSAKTFLPVIDGSGGVQECRVVVVPESASVEVRVVSALAGADSLTVSLNED